VSSFCCLMMGGWFFPLSSHLPPGCICAQGQDDKIRVVLNKADCISTQQLMRVSASSSFCCAHVVDVDCAPLAFIKSACGCLLRSEFICLRSWGDWVDGWERSIGLRERSYGAMMWSLGKVVRTPEVMRVFVGSFCLHARDRTHARTCAHPRALPPFVCVLVVLCHVTPHHFR